MCSPLGAFQRKRDGKVRVIHDLSWPPGASVNDRISKDEFSVSYISIKFAINLIHKYGKGTLFAKLDLSDAYRQIRVRKQDWPLLGSHISHNGIKYYFVDTVLPFGLRSSARIFSDFADALNFIMTKHGVSDVDHYLDDFLTGGPPNSSICANNIVKMIETCDQLNFALNMKKLDGPTTCIEFLGIIIDSIRLEIRITENRLQEIHNLLLLWSDKTICTLRELLSLIGKLSFVSQVVKHSRTFIRGLINASKRLRRLHHRLRLTNIIRLDIAWWLHFLPQWNGISLIKEHDNKKIIHLWTDASDKSLGAYITPMYLWISHELPDGLVDIAAKELYAVCCAVYTWSNILKNKRCIIHCDNQAVVEMLQAETTRHKQCIVILRSLFYICCIGDISLSSVFVGTKNNIVDPLSRNDIEAFLRDHPSNGRCKPVDPEFKYCGSLFQH